MKVLAVVVLVSVVALSRPHKAYDHLGCWKDVIHDDDLSFLPQIKRLRLKDRLSQIDQCAKSAIERGIPVFGIRNNSVCVGSVHASFTYTRYGPSTQCYNGTGGPTSVDVYGFDGNSPYHNTADEEEDGEKRNFIYDLYTSSYAQKKAAFSMNIPSNAAKHPLVRNGHVRPVFLQPLYKEIDEREFGAYKPPISGTNVLINPSFEQPLVNDPIRGWSCQGETDDPRGGVIARYTRENPKQGKYSGICLARLSEWAGPGQYIGNRVVSGRVYKFEGWTKILDRKRTGDIHNLELWVRFKKRGSKVQRSKRLARRTKFSQDYGWVHWHTAFEMPFARTGFQYVFIYFKGPKSTIDIVLDDIFLGEIPQRPDWKAYSDLLINRNRKRNIEFRVNITGSRYTTDLLPNLKLTVKQESHLFAFGAAVNSNFLLTKPKYRDFYLTNFQWAVLESSLKWGVVEPKQGLTNYVTADKAVDFLQAHNKLIRGHCVFWAVDTEVPFWVKRISNKQLKEELKDRITSLLGRYKGRFMQWDVNNEMLHGSYFADREGLSIRDWMYSVAGKIDPDVDLFVNDFDVVENGQLTQALVEEVQDLLLRGIPLDGIGVQGHFTGPVNPTLLSYRLKILSEAGVPIWLTEVDVLEVDPLKRAESLEVIMRSAFSNPSVQGLILWSFWNQSSWRGPYTSLVDGNEWRINAAGLRYRELLKQWTTHVTLAPTVTDSSNAHFETRGFFGDYDVELELSNGLRSTQKFTLNPGNGALFIYLHLPDPASSKTSSDLPSSIANAHIVTQTPIMQNTGNQDSGEFQTDQGQDEEFLEFNNSNELTDSFKTLTGSYVGCFDNSNPLRQLQYRYGEHPAMTPDVCVKHCLYKGYPFAGLLLASECFCGLYFNDDAEVSNELCKFPCQGDFRRSCGGQKDIAIYSTS
ncbi:endo-1,4-beta-xylanase 3-like isoform X1 [Acropora millepora]|uniref:endo-1,4-beta-xylanase 3-like isoform X1 n=1 Tax=Acropora millepora TaxID=45264 RepID=UPI001CF4E3D3|nr:endo-1,4-beta-xylanase 3-like isoform X1 [Acropora millepora]